MAQKYKPTGTSSLFPEEFRLEKLSKQGDPLERLNKVIDWGYFRSTREKILKNGKMVNAGHKPFDPLLMFKILILQRYYNLSDEQIEYQILDRLTFCRFWGISLNDRVPDEKTSVVFGMPKEAIKLGAAKQILPLHRVTNSIIKYSGLYS